MSRVSNWSCQGLNWDVIAGLRYVPGFVAAAEAAALVAAIDAAPWLDDLARRVQHYGWRYDYRARRVAADMYLGPLPAWLGGLVARLDFVPEQAIVNEYTPGQGISHHVDCVPCFGETIASVSLLSRCEMELRRGDELRRLMLEPGSLLVMTGEARYDWSHAIRARRSDGGVPRGRRVSVTFRTVLRA